MKISIVGSGNVATHLHRALESKAAVCLINPRTFEKFPSDADVVLIAVKDDAIADVASKLPETSAVIAHTSGSVPIEALASHASNYGVFYPLQTFSKKVNLKYSEIPVFLEASSPEAFAMLSKAAGLFTSDIREADSESRRKLHLASVFACNFTNAMIGIGADILADTGIDFSALLPLLRQTVSKLENLSPANAQTGPAIRRDQNVIERHLQMLEGSPAIAGIYSLITHYIQS